MLIIQFNSIQYGYKFSQFLGNVYRILLEEFSYIYKFEISDTHAFYVNKLRTDIRA